MRSEVSPKRVKHPIAVIGRTLIRPPHFPSGWVGSTRHYIEFSIWEQLLHINVLRFRGGLVFKAHRLCVSLNSKLESNEEEEDKALMSWARLMNQDIFLEVRWVDSFQNVFSVFIELSWALDWLRLVKVQQEFCRDTLYRGGWCDPKGSMAFLQNNFRCPPMLGARRTWRT